MLCIFNLVLSLVAIVFIIHRILVRFCMEILVLMISAIPESGVNFLNNKILFCNNNFPCFVSI